MAYERVNWQDYPSKATPLNAENLNKMDEGIANLDAESESLKAFGNEGKLVYVHDGALDTLEPSNLDLHVGSPTVVTEASQMTDSSKIYVYNGDWYSYDGDQWVDRGPFNEPEIVTDKELTVSDRPADGKVVGDRLETKANIDGAYDAMTVGSANQLISTVFVQDNAPYTFRTAGGYADIGDRMQDSIIGGSVVWNQLAGSQDRTVSANGITISFDHSTGKTTVTVSDSPTGYAQLPYYGTPAVSGHRYLICADKPLVNGMEVYIGGTTGSRGVFPAPKNQAVIETATALSGALQFYVGQSTPAGTYEYYVQIVDLTQMFGSDIADYIYSLEQAHAGDGVAFFRKMFPKSYYEYDVGTIKSLTGLAAHETTGFNQWDEEWEIGNIDSSGNNGTGTSTIRTKGYIEVVPSTSYYFKTDGYFAIIYWYDSDKTYISSNSPKDSIVVSPANARYLRFYMQSTYGTTYKNDICINLHWDGERDGEYEEYVKHTYPLDSSITLRGMLHRDVDGNFHYHGDKYEADGTVTRKYGIVDLGTLEYIKSSSPQRFEATTLVSGLKPPSSNSVAINGLCPNYVIYSIDAFSVQDKAIIINTSGYIRIYDSANYYKTAEEFKTTISGTYLVYELATPTTEQAAPFAANQVVDDFGTEAYTFTEGAFEMPVGHESKYTNNLRAKLEMAPNSPSGDGRYLVKQENGLNEYVPYVEHDPTKANIDGNYEAMTVGNAEQLVATVTVNDQAPYTFRTAGGSADIGDRLTESIVGGTVVWNQLAKAWPGERNGLTVTESNNIISLSGTSTSGYANITQDIKVSVDHTYYVYSRYVANPNNFDSLKFGFLNSAYAERAVGSESIIRVASTSGSASGITGFSTGTVFDGTKLQIVVHDLTQMFGADIADHIHVLEQANPGDGVAWFKRLFPKPYYEYNPGELKSISGLAAHETVGFNAWDEEWELGGYSTVDGSKTASAVSIRSKNKIPVFPGSTYYFKFPTNIGSYNAELFLYGADQTFLRGTYCGGSTYSTVTIPSDCYYIALQVRSEYGTTYNHDICINLRWDGERDGEYEPYIKRTYPLDSSLTLRGIPKLNETDASLYFDGDRYNPDGSVERRYGIVDLGTLTWARDSNTNYWYSSNIRIATDTYDYVNAICNKLVYSNTKPAQGSNLCFYLSGARYPEVWNDTATSSADVQAAMSGVYLVYKVDEPTVEEAEPFQSPQVVDDFGTEAYTFTEGSFVMPVGHDSKYQPNLRAKLEMVPNSPDEDGTYLLSHYNGQNTYIPYVAPRGIPMINPSEDGEYELILTMSNGTPTLEWTRIYNPNQS